MHCQLPPRRPEPSWPYNQGRPCRCKDRLSVTITPERPIDHVSTTYLQSVAYFGRVPSCMLYHVPCTNLSTNECLRRATWANRWTVCKEHVGSQCALARNRPFTWYITPGCRSFVGGVIHWPQKSVCIAISLGPVPEHVPFGNRKIMTQDITRRYPCRVVLNNSTVSTDCATLYYSSSGHTVVG